MAHSSSLQKFMDQLPEQIEYKHSALIAIDVQPDFMAGGPLACANGEDVVAPLAQLMTAQLFNHVVATQDWHPAHHISFISQHPDHHPFDLISLYGHEQVLWPDHCIMNTPGANLHADIDWQYADLILRKGFDPLVDSYSAFRHNSNQQGERQPTGLAGWLHEAGVTDLYLCGLARDVCVLWSAEDAVAAGFNVHLLWPLTRPVTYDTNKATLATLAQHGIDVLGQSVCQ